MSNNKYNQLLSKGLLSSLNNTDIESGKIRFTTDSEELYIDTEDKRIKISDFVTGFTESDILGIIAPLPKIYISSDTNELYFYNNEWVRLGIVPDSELDINSNNPISNKAVTEVINKTVFIDKDEISENIEPPLPINADLLQSHNSEYFVNRDEFSQYYSTSTFLIDKVGWYRIAKYPYKHRFILLGNNANSCRFIIKSLGTYSSSYEFSLQSVYEKQELIALNCTTATKQHLTAIRYTIENESAYLEIYFNSTIPLSSRIELYNSTDSYTGYWQLINPVILNDANIGEVRCEIPIPKNNRISTSKELNLKTNCINITEDYVEKGKMHDYRKCVIACVKTAEKNTSNSSWLSGSFSFHRYNGLNYCAMKIDVFISSEYELDNGITINIFESSNYDHPISRIKPCVFKYNGIYYGGIEFETVSLMSSIVFQGTSSFIPFFLEYYDTKNDISIIDEIANSIDFSKNRFFINNSCNGNKLITSVDLDNYLPSTTDAITQSSIKSTTANGGYLFYNKNEDGSLDSQIGGLIYSKSQNKIYLIKNNSDIILEIPLDDSIAHFNGVANYIKTTYSNELNICNLTNAQNVFINYRNADTNTSSGNLPITHYSFYDKNGAAEDANMIELVMTEGTGIRKILHTGNSKLCIESLTAPKDYSAWWWDTTENKIKRYVDGAWQASKI